MQTENNMTREELYIKLGRIERVAMECNLCFKINANPEFLPDDVAFDCGHYAEVLCAYLRANNDEQLMIDCCKINRHILYRYGGTRDKLGLAMSTTTYYLRKIHDLALEKIWHIGRDDIENCTYYVNSVEGVCRNSSTGELKPKPSTDTDTPTEPANAPAKGLPSELGDTPNVYKYFNRAVKAGYLKCNDNVYTKDCTNAQLGYICSKIFEQPRPITALEKYFDTTRLSTAITQASYEVKRADVKKWHTDIDSKIFYD
jgi:hypothetical protein